jgi:hypothetical protein
MLIRLRDPGLFHLTGYRTARKGPGGKLSESSAGDQGWRLRNAHLAVRRVHVSVRSQGVLCDYVKRMRQLNASPINPNYRNAK